MAQNTAAVYSKTPNISGANFGTAAANDFDGTSANYATAFTADAVEGSFVESILLKANGTNAAGVARIFLNNGSTPATAANNHLIKEQTLLASTSSTSVPTSVDIEVPINRRLKPGWKILIGSPAALAAGWHATTFGGDYA